MSFSGIVKIILWVHYFSRQEYLQFRLVCSTIFPWSPQYFDPLVSFFRRSIHHDMDFIIDSDFDRVSLYVIFLFVTDSFYSRHRIPITRGKKERKIRKLQLNLLWFIFSISICKTSVLHDEHWPVGLPMCHLSYFPLYNHFGSVDEG